MNLWKQKAAALAIHLAFSLACLALPLYAVAAHFYPGDFFMYDGGWAGMRIALLVDVVLGPCCMAAVYKKGKKGMLLDSAVILFLQLLAFGYGAYTLYHVRPIALAFGGDMFHSLSLPNFRAPKDLEELSALSKTPVVVAAQRPSGLEDKKALLAKIQSGPGSYAAYRDIWVTPGSGASSGQLEKARFGENAERMLAGEPLALAALGKLRERFGGAKYHLCQFRESFGFCAFGPEYEFLGFEPAHFKSVLQFTFND